MFEGGVKVCFFTERFDLRKVREVDVRVDSEEPLHDVADDLEEVLRVWVALLGGEDAFVVDLAFDPRHQELDVEGCTHLCGLFVFVTISPVVFIALSRGHHRAA